MKVRLSMPLCNASWVSSISGAIRSIRPLKGAMMASSKIVVKELDGDGGAC